MRSYSRITIQRSIVRISRVTSACTDLSHDAGELREAISYHSRLGLLPTGRVLCEEP
jgi:hypothetical protein